MQQDPPTAQTRAHPEDLRVYIALSVPIFLIMLIGMALVVVRMSEYGR